MAAPLTEGPHRMDQAGLSRRRVLAGAGLLAIAACSTGNEPLPPEPDPDAPIRALAIDGVRRLVQAYDAVSRAHPSLRSELAPLAAETMAHLSALDPPAAGATTAPSTQSPGSTPSPTATAPPRAADAQASLARAERQEADLRVAQLAHASAGLARLLAAIGASEATHATLLGADR